MLHMIVTDMDGNENQTHSQTIKVLVWHSLEYNIRKRTKMKLNELSYSKLLHPDREGSKIDHQKKDE